MLLNFCIMEAMSFYDPSSNIPNRHARYSRGALFSGLEPDDNIVPMSVETNTKSVVVKLQCEQSSRSQSACVPRAARSEAPSELRYVHQLTRHTSVSPEFE